MESPSEPTGDSNASLQKPVEIDQALKIGLASQICLAIHDILNQARQRISSGTNVHSSNLPKRIVNEAERFALWIDEFAASSGRLDNILDNSKELRIAIYPLLYELGKIVYHGSIDSTLLSLGNRESSRKLGKLRTLLSDLSSTPELAVDHGDDGSSEDGRSIASDAQDILDDVAFYVDSLMDMSPALEAPILDLDTTETHVVMPPDNVSGVPSNTAETSSDPDILQPAPAQRPKEDFLREAQAHVETRSQKSAFGVKSSESSRSRPTSDSRWSETTYASSNISGSGPGYQSLKLEIEDDIGNRRPTEKSLPAARLESSAQKPRFQRSWRTTSNYVYQEQNTYSPPHRSPPITPGLSLWNLLRALVNLFIMWFNLIFMSLLGFTTTSLSVLMVMRAMPDGQRLEGSIRLSYHIFRMEIGRAPK